MSTIEKPAKTQYPIHEILRDRWSPRAFSTESLSTETIGSLLEAARWAPSSNNLQPWRFIIATRDDAEAYEKLLSVINEFNRDWAKSAPLLLLAVAKQTKDNGKTNKSALHDLGLAVAQLTTQATAMDLYLHQMGGILPDKAREIYSIPDDYLVHTAIAVGYADDPETLPDKLAKRERQERSRQPLSEFVFREWQTPAPQIED